MDNFSKGDLVAVRLDGDSTWIPAIYSEKKNEYHAVNLANITQKGITHLVKECRYMIVNHTGKTIPKLYNAILYLSEVLGSIQDGVLPQNCTKSETGMCKYQRFIHNSDSNWPDSCSECWLNYVMSKFDISDEELHTNEQ